VTGGAFVCAAAVGRRDRRDSNSVDATYAAFGCDIGNLIMYVIFLFGWTKQCFLIYFFLKL
jgi:hypothetical protein